MNLKSIWKSFIQRNRDAAQLSVCEMRALTNQYEAYHGDFACLSEQSMVRADELTEIYPRTYYAWNVSFSQ